MALKEVKTLFKEIVEDMGLSGIKISLVPMKRKIASFSFRTKTLRLNSRLIGILEQELVRHIIIHELVHFKSNDVNHGRAFYEELQKYYTKEDSKILEEKLVQKLVFDLRMRTLI